MLVKLLADEKPDHIAVAFDAGAPTFRDEIDPEYKAGRKETPDLFRPQVGLIHEVLDALAIPTLEVEGVEADDVIATLADRAADDELDVIIVTGDRDSYQLVRDPQVAEGGGRDRGGIQVLYNRRGVSDYVLYDEAGIEEKTGVTPEHYPELAALRGDKSDNLPGVPGVGDKTAAKLINTYGSLEEIFEQLDEQTPKLRENLAEWQERVITNREMIELRRNVDLDVEPADLKQASFDREKVRVLFDQLAFRALWERLLEAIGEEATEAGASLDIEVEVVEKAGAAAKLLDRVRDAGERYALEGVWEGLPGHSALSGLAVATGDGAPAYLPAAALDTATAGKALDALVGSDVPVVAHGAKELTHGLGERILSGLDLDTEIAAYLVDPGSQRYDLEGLALRYLGVDLAPTEEGKAQGTLDLDGDAAEGAALAERAGRRAAAVLRLAGELRDVLEARELTHLYDDIERPLVPVLAGMERVGIAVDLDFLEELSTDLTKERDRLEHEIHGHAGEPFNVNSTKQLREVLFDRLGLTPVKRTPKGEPSTDADSLERLSEEHPIVEQLLRYREVEKLRSTYADALPPLVADDGRIHTTFKQTGTTTGRISSERPNLQNIPIRTADGRVLRKAFVAEAGNESLAADYSQIELRVLAHLADDPGLIEAFERDADIHTITAAAVFDVEEAAVDDGQRRFAKVVNYGLAYGMEAYGLGQRLGIETEEAREILDSYFESFPNVAAFMDETVKDARKKGYTTTLFGRRRMLPELSSDNFRIRQMGERMAQNAPVQGTAADIFKLAMIDLDRELSARSLETRMLLTVHDELVFEVPDAEVDDAVTLVVEVMEAAAELRVPLKVDAHTGATWADAKG